MEFSMFDDSRKAEWQKLRHLRLRQVQEQSKQISKDLLRKTEEKRQVKKISIRSKKEEVLNEWKRCQIQDLEEKYISAMEEVGLAAKQAEEEIECEERLAEKRAENQERAKIRGKVAGQIEHRRLQDISQKENQLMRRKQMTREIEDIRSGLIVQSRDWDVINRQQRRPVLANLQSNVSSQPRQHHTLPGRKSHVKRQVLKTQKSPKVHPRPYPSTIRSPLKVPKLPSNLEEMVSSDRDIISPLPEGFINGATYRMPSSPRKLQTNRPQVENIATSPLQSTVEGHVPIELMDRSEIDSLLRRYNHSLPSKRLTPYLLEDSLDCTPPTHEDDSMIGTAKTQKRAKKPRKGSRGSSESETKKLFAAIDKALENGRQLRGEVHGVETSTKWNSDSDSESGNDGILKLIVNVNCPPGCEKARYNACKTKNDEARITSPNINGSVGSPTQLNNDIQGKPDKNFNRDKYISSNNLQNNKASKNVSTEVGKSLEASESISRSDENIRRLKKSKDAATEVGDSIDVNSSEKTTECSGSKDTCNTLVGEPRQYFHYIQEPLQRTSTVENLSSKTSTRAPLLQSMSDVSSINEVTPIKCKRFVSMKHVPRHDIPDRSSSSTVYLELPKNSKGECQTDVSKEKIIVNPLLEYYIRKLLDQPDNLESAREADCTDCRCSGQTNVNEKFSENSVSNQHWQVMNKQTNKNDITDSPKEIPNDNRIQNFTDAHDERIKRLEKIAQLKNELAEIRKLRILSSNSSEGNHTTSTSSSLDGSSTTTQQSKVVDPRLSTIIEVDSQQNIEENKRVEHTAIADYTDNMDYLLKKKLINRPFKWANKSSTSDDESFHSADKCDDSASVNKSLPVPRLDISSILSPRSSIFGSEANYAEHREQMLSPASSDISQLMSQIDLSWCKRL